MNDIKKGEDGFYHLTWNWSNDNNWDTWDSATTGTITWSCQVNKKPLIKLIDWIIRKLYYIRGKINV